MKEPRSGHRKERNILASAHEKGADRIRPLLRIDLRFSHAPYMSFVTEAAKATGSASGMPATSSDWS